uniref:SFRICE_021333 n=1 Tax=Spodoptera frugiperda TaxID=7108 RepID=A0A2H1WMK4_SPOFR
MASTAIAFGQTGFEKLKGAENYSTWKFTMHMLLIHEELWNCVEAEPSEDSDKKKVDKALARIALSVTPAVIPYIRTAKSAHEAWKILQKAYEGRGLSRRLGLLRSLFNTKLSENSSMEVYLNKIKEISHQLNEIESPLDDEFVAVIMLSGLTDDYDPLIMAIEHSTSKLSTEIISQKLLQETQKREEKTVETALITQKQPKCFGCGAKGHMIRKCPKKKGPAKVQNQGNDPPTQRNPMKKSARNNKALLTALSVKVNSDVWYIDSGATNHMCNSEKVMKRNRML